MRQVLGFFSRAATEPRAAKNSLGSLFKLDRNRKARYKSLSHPGYAKASVNFFLTGNSVFQLAMQQYMVARQIEKMFPVRIRAPVPVLPSTLFPRVSPLPTEKEREKSPGRPAGRGSVPQKSLLAGYKNSSLCQALR